SIAGSGLAAQQAMKRADLAQNAGQFAADLGLRSRGMQDQTVLGLMNARAQLLDMAQRGEITREQMAQQMAMLNKQLASAWDIANLQSQTQLQLGEDKGGGGFWDTLGGIFKAATPIVLGAALGKSGPPGASTGLSGLAQAWGNPNAYSTPSFMDAIGGGEWDYTNPNYMYTPLLYQPGGWQPRGY